MGIITNEELLEKFGDQQTQKAEFSTPDLGAAVSVEAADRWIQLATKEQDMLDDVRVVRHTSAKWQEAFLDFANRIARPKVENQRLAFADRTKPTVSMVEMSTVAIIGEVPISDESFEDALGGGAQFRRSVTTGMANRFGYDVEDLLLNGDTTSGDSYLALTDGWLKLARGAGGNIVNATGATSPIAIMDSLLRALPDKWKRNIQRDGRFYCNWTFIFNYREELRARGTALGDTAITDNNELRYQGIALRPVANWPVDTAATPDATYVLLTNRLNLYAGFRRAITLETFRDPRDGATSFITTARVDAEIGVVEATAIATNVNNEM